MGEQFCDVFYKAMVSNGVRISKESVQLLLMIPFLL